MAIVIPQLDIKTSLNKLFRLEFHGGINASKKKSAVALGKGR